MLTKKICSTDRHQPKKNPFAYLSNINDATFPKLSIYQEIKKKLQFEELYYYISFTFSTLSIYTKSSS